MSSSVSYRVTHRTEYAYESDVVDSYGQAHLLPRDTPWQRCLSSELAIDPAPMDYREHVDFFGNRVAYVAIHERHRALNVTASSVVEVQGAPSRLSLFGERSWEEVREAARGSSQPDGLDAVQFVLDSPRVRVHPEIASYAAPSFTPGRRFLDAVTEISHRIHSDFRYEPGATSVATPVEDLFAKREGVCQDFAHLGIACLRAMGLPARYVSGYLETDPPPGRPKLQGADGSHAWFSVLVPEAGWLDVDPTNDQFANTRYVVAAYGRDYGDVPPLSGVIYTEGRTASLKVTVDVVPLTA
jgi:transglutaminase-like putative cysteine protease